MAETATKKRGGSKKTEGKEVVERRDPASVAVAEVGKITLKEIVEATLDASRGFIYTSPAIHAPLAEAGLVEVNPAMTNEAGEIATRATEKGQHQMSNSNTNENTAVAEAGKNGFVLESDVPMPTVKRGGRGGEVYPFDAMAVGQSFFVAATTDKPNPAKSLASTVSSATARYAVVDPEGKTKTNKKGETVPVMVETRKFQVRSVDETAQGRGKGARVWRIA